MFAHYSINHLEVQGVVERWMATNGPIKAIKLDNAIDFVHQTFRRFLKKEQCAGDLLCPLPSQAARLDGALKPHSVTGYQETVLGQGNF